MRSHAALRACVLARQDLAQAQVDALAETATKIIEDDGGKVVKTETWGLRSPRLPDRQEPQGAIM